MKTPDVTIYEYRKFGLIFYGYFRIYDDNIISQYNSQTGWKYYYYDENEQKVYVPSNYFYYSDTTGEKTYINCGDEYGYWYEYNWFYFLDKTNVKYIFNIYEYIAEHGDFTIPFRVTFICDTDPSGNTYNLSWIDDYDSSAWYENYDHQYQATFTINADVHINNNNSWSFNYPKEWKIKSLYEFHTESGGGDDSGSGSGSGGGGDCVNLKTIDFKRADDLSALVSADSAFSGCSKLIDVDFSNATFQSLTNTENMFYNCNSLVDTSIIINNSVTFGNLVYADNMFCSYFEGYDDYTDTKYGVSCCSETLVSKFLSLVNNGTFNTYIGNMYLRFIKNGVKYVIESMSDVSVATDYYVGNITIPQTVSEANTTFNVTGIKRAAFVECDSLSTVNIVSTYITTIPSYTFYKCENLTTVTMPNTIENIYSHAFQNCGITSITIPQSVTYIDNYVFVSSNSIRSAIIQSDIDLTNTHLHVENNDIVYIVFDKSNVSIGQAPQTANVVNIPSTVTMGNTFTVVEVGDMAFKGCTITSVTLPNTIRTIRTYAFGYAKISSLTLPDNITTIESEAFYDSRIDGLNMSVAYLDLPNLSRIGFTFGVNNLIYKIENKTTVSSVGIINKNDMVGTYTFPSSVFYKTNEFTNVQIDNEFDGCTRLVSLDTSNATYKWTSHGDMFSGCVSLCSVTPVLRFDDGGFCENVFTNCTSITNIANVAATTFNQAGRIDEMFMNCTSLTSVDLIIKSRNTWSTISSGGGYEGTEMRRMFKGCTNITSVALRGDGLSAKTTSQMFMGCTSLETALVNMFGEVSVRVADFIRRYYIDVNEMFSGCTQLEDVTITVPLDTYIMYDGQSKDVKAELNGCLDMFKDCESLTNLTLKTGRFGVVFVSDLSLADSPLLTFNSMKNVCECTSSGISVTFNSTAWGQLANEQITTLSGIVQDTGATITNMI